MEELTAGERTLLQKAATMGGVFWLGGLIVLDRDHREPPELWSSDDEQGVRDLADSLTRLVERDYILKLPDSTFPGDEEYVFRQRAERDRIAALTSGTDARKWHRLLADWLDSQPETRSHEEYLQLLGEQREKAGAAESAAGAYLEAAGQARAHASPKRELAYYERALALLGEDGHSRRLSALFRAAELLDQVDREEEALGRYREAATLAFRLNRRRLWESAHLAANRLAERLAVRAEAKEPAEVAAQPTTDATAPPGEPLLASPEPSEVDEVPPPPDASAREDELAAEDELPHEDELSHEHEDELSHEQEHEDELSHEDELHREDEVPQEEELHQEDELPPSHEWVSAEEPVSALAEEPATPPTEITTPPIEMPTAVAPSADDPPTADDPPAADDLPAGEQATMLSPVGVPTVFEPAPTPIIVEPTPSLTPIEATARPEEIPEEPAAAATGTETGT
jgi:hypothetical protein